MGNKSFSVLPPTGDDFNPGKLLKHYWVVIKGLPLKLGGKFKIQSLVNGFLDLIEIDWYNDKWLDNRWVRVKLAMADLSLMPPQMTVYSGKYSKEESCVAHFVKDLTLRSFLVGVCISIATTALSPPFPRRLFPDLNSREVAVVIL